MTKETNLQRLRREAGFSTAKEFAAKLNIPASTYTRYEQPTNDVVPNIPLRSAWLIADELDSSIDTVVGRRPITPIEADGNVQRAFDALSPAKQKTLESFLAFLHIEEEREQEEAIREQVTQYQALCIHFLRLFNREHQKANSTNQTDKHTTDNCYRDEFLRYLYKRAEKAAVRNAERAEEDTYALFDEGVSVFPLFPDDGEIKEVYCDEPDYHDIKISAAKEVFDTTYRNSIEVFNRNIHRMMDTFESAKPIVDAEQDSPLRNAYEAIAQDFIRQYESMALKDYLS